jgi:hypothetical protein
VIYSQPATTAKLGAEYRYEVRANRSLGDLSARMQGENQVSGYFDIEKPSFKLEHASAWLKVDPNTGVVFGVPDATGKTEVALSVSLTRERRQLDEKILAWGNEKVLTNAVETVGTATQKFMIQVQ